MFRDDQVAVEYLFHGHACEPAEGWAPQQFFGGDVDGVGVPVEVQWGGSEEVLKEDGGVGGRFRS